ncbi:MAG: BamA/TamA family outer membrane protein [Bacteroidetes bacterium]|jgi:outer membrane protein assembly factor BamA|nr:BamA/TamA family outer membrane protein [Bacteroidota bacterium]
MTPSPRSGRWLRVALIATASAWFATSSRAQSTVPAVREVIIRGNVRTQATVILREMSLRPGAPLTDEGLQRDRERIYNLQLFNRVEVDAHRLGDSADVYVSVDERWYVFPYPIVNILHRDPKKLVYGLGLTHQNLLGLNQRLFVEGVIGYDQYLQGIYRNPRFLGDDDLAFQVQSGYFDQHPLSRDSSEEYEQITALAVASVGRRFGFYETMTAGLGVEMWRVPQAVAYRTASVDGRDLFLSASLQYVFDRRNLREYPTEGMYMSFLAVKDGFGESAVNIFRLGFDLRRYDLLSDEATLASRAFGRWVTGGTVPSYRRAFFGYEERLRGSFSQVREGERRLGGSVELRVPVISPRYYEAPFIPIPQFNVLRYGVYLGVFVDAGTVWYRSVPFSSVPWWGGAGTGLHFILPYGLVVRTEWAMNERGIGELIFDVGASF